MTRRYKSLKSAKAAIKKAGLAFNVVVYDPRPTGIVIPIVISPSADHAAEVRRRGFEARFRETDWL